MDLEMPMMSCGCVANSIDQDGNPACVVHFMISGKGANPVPVEMPDLSGRQARCSYDHGHGCPKRRGLDSRIPSNPKSAFFKHQPDSEYDAYYCGCWGWD